MDLGLDRDDVVGALEAFGPAVERPMDLARVGERVFVNNASLGVYAEAVQRPGYREAKRATIAADAPRVARAGGRAPRSALRGPGRRGAARSPRHPDLQQPVPPGPPGWTRVAGPPGTPAA